MNTQPSEKRRLKSILVALAVSLICCHLSCPSFGHESFLPEKEERKAGDRMTLTIKDVEYAFRWCPPGTFIMGSPVNELGRTGNGQQRQVTLEHGFWMLETPVTQVMWKTVMGLNPSQTKGDKLPVGMVSWNDCQEYITKLNELDIAPTGFKFSLPMETQWEYACRAGTTTAWHFGDTVNRNQANVDRNLERMSEVRSYPANAWGLFDMHGNVGEWCADLFNTYPPSNLITDDMRELRGHRVRRGGAWDVDASWSRSAARTGAASTSRVNSMGLRLVLVFLNKD